MAQRNDKIIPPSPEVISMLQERGRHTPDFNDLRRYEYIPVFIYDSELMQCTKGKSNWLLGFHHSYYLGKAYTVTDKYILKQAGDIKVRNVAFDSKLDATNPMSHKAKNYIRGEVYALHPRSLLNVDYYLGNNRMFRREQRSFFMADQDSPFRDDAWPTFRCYIHMGIPEYWNNFKMEKRPVINEANFKGRYVWVP